MRKNRGGDVRLDQQMTDHMSAAHPSQAHCLMTERWAAPVHPFPTGPFQSHLPTFPPPPPGRSINNTHGPAVEG